MRIFFTSCLLLFFQLSFAQSFGDMWADADENQIFLDDQSELSNDASEYRVLELDFDRLVNVLRLAPQEFSAAAKSAPLQIQLPHPDGSMVDYRIVESSNMHPNLQAKYPNIRAYKFWQVGKPHLNGRLDYSPNGLNAVFTTDSGKVLIQPYASNQKTFHLSYYLKHSDYAEEIYSFSCGTETEESDMDHHINDIVPQEVRGTLRDGEPVDLRVYRFALACTGEFAQQQGGTVEGVVAAFNTAVNIVNSIFENEVAIRVQLIEGNDNLIWLDPNTDPYPLGNVGATETGNNGVMQRNTIAITNFAGIPLTAFDLGHAFTGPCVGIAGVASLGSVCMDNRGAGLTCHSSSNVAIRALGTMPHEIGHQFTLGHSWSNCPGALEQLSSGSAYEPGSGSTIMSYAGACGDQNVIFGDDTYYHVHNLQQFINRSRSVNDCSTIQPTTNIEPELTLDYEDGFFIPISTPFELKAEATDENGDQLTYCWEQYNLGPLSSLGEPFGNAPIFRSYPPTELPNRIFPRLEVLLQNGMEDVEVLPTYTRDLNFRCTVRDNNPEAGAAIWKEVEFKATASAGPFLVQSPNATNEVWESGEYVEVTWDVANTNNEVVNCQFVNIKLSIDFGFTYPYTLALNTLNDGSEFITVPADVTADNRARVKIEAVNNIFFDLSNENFDIIEPQAPGFTLVPNISAQQVCLPNAAVVEFSTDPLLNFSNPIQLEVVDGLPQGALASFSANNISPSESSTLNIDMTDVVEPGTYTITVRGISQDTDTLLRTIDLVVVSNDFSDMSLTSPVDGNSDIILGTDFDWEPSNNAITYDFELANNASFAPGAIVESGSGLTQTDFQLGTATILEENELYYWRVRPVNECGPGPWLDPFAFHTQAVACEETPSDDIPIPISGTGTPTITSSLFITESGTISDINLPFMRGSYQPVNSLRIILESPAETQVVLFDQDCGNTVNLRIGFDDEAPQTIQCPPDDAVVNQPIGNLSDFIGENTQGEWKLIMDVVETGFGGGGGLDEWSLEFCATLSPKNPFLVTNEPLEVPPGEENPILGNNLSVQDEDNTATELTYNLVTLPEHGTLRRVGQQLLSTGSTFTQQNIDLGHVFYQHDGSDTTEDSFLFTVEDPTGGWLVTQRFNIIITEDAVVSTIEPVKELDFTIAPNPAKNEVFVNLLYPVNDDIQLSLLNIQGQRLFEQNYNGTQNRIRLDVSNLPSGIYLVAIHTRDGIITKKVNINK